MMGTGQLHALAASPLGQKRPLVPIGQELGLIPKIVWMKWQCTFKKLNII